MSLREILYNSIPSVVPVFNGNIINYNHITVTTPASNVTLTPTQFINGYVYCQDNGGSGVVTVNIPTLAELDLHFGNSNVDKTFTFTVAAQRVNSVAWTYVLGDGVITASGANTFGTASFASYYSFTILRTSTHYVLHNYNFVPA